MRCQKRIDGLILSISKLNTQLPYKIGTSLSPGSWTGLNVTVCRKHSAWPSDLVLPSKHFNHCINGPTQLFFFLSFHMQASAVSVTLAVKLVQSQYICDLIQQSKAAKYFNKNMNLKFFMNKAHRIYLQQKETHQQEPIFFSKHKKADELHLLSETLLRPKLNQLSRKKWHKETFC